MAGHSKWANIKHRKGAQDAKRGKIFTKLIREITVSAKLGGEDASSNPRLRAAIDHALGQNMTKDTIARAVKRGAGGEEGTDLIEITYEGYGPSGVAVLVECLTDNRNRTVAEVRHAFSKAGGNLGTDGSVAFLFTKKGLIQLSASLNEETVMEVALEHGAEDIQHNHADQTLTVWTSPQSMHVVKEALSNASLTPEKAQIDMIASNEVDLDLDGAEKLLRLIERLEDLDDVQNVYSNAAITDDILSQL